MTAPLTTAAALLSIAADSPANVVTILPARCHVANEWILGAALNQLQSLLPRIPEGVGTLGMIEIDNGIDEDYLVSGPERSEPWSCGASDGASAHRLDCGASEAARCHGSLWDLTGYVRVFAAHAFKHWPGLSRKLAKVMRVAESGERRFHADGYREMARSVLRSLRWWPPIFPQRALRVYRCGFRGLQTARAVAKVIDSYPAAADSLMQYGAQADFESLRSPLATLAGDPDRVTNRSSLQYADSKGGE